MNRNILFLLLLLLLLIPVSQAGIEPEATSYWGNVAVDVLIQHSNAIVKVL